MTTILDYKVLTKIYESARSLVYRAQRRNDTSQPVILKVLKEDFLNPEELARYQREYDITHALALTGIVNVYALEKYQNTLVMVLEDFGGESLKQHLTKRRFTLTEFLSIAIQIVENLAQVHAANIIHKDLNPTNIIFSPSTWQLKITDFGIASRLPRENPIFKNPECLEGTLAYMSPEQTGRMNRAMDYRTDFYALGVTFYELLTLHLPFETEDTMELVHCHLAKQPGSPQLLNPSIPEMISRIIMKLLEKTAEARYQSAWGLKHDLEVCRQQLQSKGQIADFILGQQDVSDKFQLPQKLYGRQQEVETLLSIFELASLGNTEMMLISGHGGVGKSSLVHEIYKPITQKRGYFIAGKFDQMQRNIPYSAIIQAFRDLIRQLLTESETQLVRWKQELLAALGNNSQILIEVIPELELIVGSPAAVPTYLSATEAQNRFHLIWANFLRVIGHPSHPLVIFLDDLQWADAASLKLIALMMRDTPALLLIGAYQENRMDTTHPLFLAIEEIQQIGVNIHTLSLAPLSPSQVQQLIADTFNSSCEEISALAELVFQKTQGNPFFINQFLKSLYDDKLIELMPPFCEIEPSPFDSQKIPTDGISAKDTIGMTTYPRTTRSSCQSYWRWDLTKIRARGLSDNVVALLTDRIQKLSDQTQQVLMLAACIGGQFNLRILAIIYESSPQDTVAELWEAIVEGLVVPLEESHDLMTPNEIAKIITVEYKFAHDRIRQAVYSLIPEEERCAVHLQVGRTLLAHLPSEESEQNIFAVVDQLNLGREWMTQQSERDELALLNLIAGRKAKISAAYDPAFKYFKIGLELLGRESWQRLYELTLALGVEAAEMAYLCSELDDMEQFVTQVLREAVTLLDKVKIYEIQIQALVAQNKLLEAVSIALAVLKLLDVHFPLKPSKWHTLSALLRTKQKLSFGKKQGGSLTQKGHKTIKDLLHLPKMTDANQLAIMRILSQLYSATYKAVPELFPLTVFKQICLSVDHGNAAESAFAYAAYGLILCALEKDIEAGHQFGALALDLLDKFQARELKARTLMIVNTHIKHWHEPIRNTLPPLLAAYQSGLETGEIEFAVTSANAYCYMSYISGKEITTQEKDIASYSHTMAQFKHEGGLRLNNLFHQVVLNLLECSDKVTSKPYCLTGDKFIEETMLPQLIHSNDRTTLCLLYFNKLNLCYWFGEYSQAVANANLAEQYLDGVRGLCFTPLFYFYDSLARLAIYPQLAALGKFHQLYHQTRLLGKVATNQHQMKKWAHHAPMNYLHKYLLVEAERARVLGKINVAREYYHKAITLAQKHEYLQEEALAYELAAKFYQSRSEENQLAHYYFRNAYHAYQRWGANAKLRDLEARYPEIFFQSEVSSKAPGKGILSNLTTSISYSTQYNLSSVLDLNSVLKASQTISEEIVLDKLLAKLIKIVIENAGAQQGTLILNEQGELKIEAQGTIEQKEVRVLQSLSLSQLATDQTLLLVPLTLINYVARAREPIVLQEAAHTGKFTRDPYIIKHQIQSALCVPLVNQSQLIGILYLENNLVTGAFTPTRLEVLNLLSSQIAISIKNAKLYADTQALNTKLRESEERFRIIAETTPIPLVITRMSDNTILYANAQATLNFGLSAIEPLGSCCITDFYCNPADQERLQETFNKYGYIHNYELQVKKNDGSIVWGALFSHTIIYKHEKVLLTAIYDITDRKQAEEERVRFTKELSDSEERFRIIAETTPIPLLIVRLSDNLILYANAQIETIFGLPPEALIGHYHTVDFHCHPEEGEKLLEVFQRDGYVRNFELLFKKIDGATICGAIFIQPIVFKNEPALAGAIYDITDRKRAEEERIRFIREREAKNAALQLNEQLQQEIQERQRAEAALAKANQELGRLATLDGLTQLANRRRFDEYIDIEWRRAAREQLPLSLILCDIDYFKRYNDKYGHQAGDDCLRQVARAMNRAVRRPADLVARYGGEEFVVVLPNTKAEGAVQVAATMQREVEQLQLAHAASEVNDYVTLSLGVACTIPSQTFLPEVLIRIADNALYEAKERGRNCLVLKTTV